MKKNKIVSALLILLAVSALTGCLFDNVVDKVVDTPRMISVSGAVATLPNDPQTSPSLCGEEGFYGAYQRQIILLTKIPYETGLKEIRWNINGHYFTTEYDVFTYPFKDIGQIPFTAVVVDMLGREISYSGKILVRSSGDYF